MELFFDVKEKRSPSLINNYRPNYLISNILKSRNKLAIQAKIMKI